MFKDWMRVDMMDYYIKLRKNMLWNCSFNFILWHVKFLNPQHKYNHNFPHRNDLQNKRINILLQNDNDLIHLI